MSSYAPTPAVTSRRRGFTLIELLVVISIIALLISILLPALGKARASASMVTCLTHIRAVTQAVAMYNNNQKEYYPYGFDARPPGSVETNKQYFQALMPYLGLQATNDYRADAANPILHCTQIWDEWAKNHTSGVGTEFGVFGFNPHMMGYVYSDGNYAPAYSLFPAGHQNVKIADIDSRFQKGQGPSSTVLLFDGFRPIWYTVAINNPIFANSPSNFSAPHFDPTNTRDYTYSSGAGRETGYLATGGGKMSVAYMDGHAKTVAPTAFPGGTGFNSWQVAP